MKKVITGLPDELFALEEISKEQQVIKYTQIKGDTGKQ